MWPWRTRHTSIDTCAFIGTSISRRAEDPFTGHIACEPGAAPYTNFNEKFTAECHQLNAELGNVEHTRFDIEQAPTSIGSSPGSPQINSRHVHQSTTNLPPS